jgi:hypothetical protein
VPKDIVGILHFLAFDASSLVTGQALTADGGCTHPQEPFIVLANLGDAIRRSIASLPYHQFLPRCCFAAVRP